MKRASIGDRITAPFDHKQMAATTSAGSGFRYKSVTNNVLAASAASGTRNLVGAASPDSRAPLVTPLAHSTTVSQRMGALNQSVDSKVNIQDNPSMQTILRVKMGYPLHSTELKNPA